MGHGAYAVYTVSMTSGDSLTSALDLGRSFPCIYVEIASTPSATDHQMKVAATLGGTYNTVYHPSLNSSTVTTNPYKVASGVTGAVVPFPGGFQFIKIWATAAMANGCTYKVYCGDE